MTRTRQFLIFRDGLLLKPEISLVSRKQFNFESIGEFPTSSLDC